jgi:hypothetical protein
MKNRIHAVVILAMAFVVYGDTSGTKVAQSPGHRVLKIEVLKDGPGPMCPPTSGCGNQ